MKTVGSVMRLICMTLTAVTANVVAAADPAISLNRVQQRYPWNGMVDIDYTVSDVPSGSEADYYVRFKIVENGKTHVLHEFIDNTTLVDASNGTYRVTWKSASEDAECQFFTKTGTVWAELVNCGGDKANNPYGNQYVVIDLSAGTTEATTVSETYPVTSEWLTFRAATNKYNAAEYKTTKLVLRRVYKGEFTMGAPVGEFGRQAESFMGMETQHRVTLSKDFLLGMFAVTQAQFIRVMGAAANNSGNNKGDNDYPVVTVSYQTIRGSATGCSVPPAFGNTDTDSFMEKISRRTGLAFDLPTEAQWEYACRAGTTDNTYAGSVTTHPSSITAAISWYSDNAKATTRQVGQKLPNDWGFYDMLGNVWEICRDRISSNLADTDLGSADVTDPLGAVEGGNDPIRGGGYDSPAGVLRAACRPHIRGVTFTDNNLGFRVSRTLP